MFFSSTLQTYLDSLLLPLTPEKSISKLIPSVPVSRHMAPVGKWSTKPGACSVYIFEHVSMCHTISAMWDGEERCPASAWPKADLFIVTTTIWTPPPRSNRCFVWLFSVYYACCSLKLPFNPQPGEFKTLEDIFPSVD